jgi:hypothetical protein
VALNGVLLKDGFCLVDVRTLSIFAVELKPCFGEDLLLRRDTVPTVELVGNISVRRIFRVGADHFFVGGEDGISLIDGRTLFIFAVGLKS